MSVKRSIYALAAAVLVTLAFIASTVWAELSDRVDARGELLITIGEIARIDEVLTSSARLAAVTGERQYVDRYNDNVVKLDSNIARALTLFDSPEVRRMLGQTDAANRVLVSIEEAALAVSDRPNPEAYAALKSGIYLRNKALYSEGVDEVFAELRDMATREIGMTRLLLTALALLALLCSAASVRLYWLGRADAIARAEREKKIDTMRALIATFMDVQNNLLNNMVFLRMKAEAGQALGPGDIDLIDREMARAQEKLKEIARADAGTRRDLGGIIVLCDKALPEGRRSRASSRSALS